MSAYNDVHEHNVGKTLLLGTMTPRSIRYIDVDTVEITMLPSTGSKPVVYQMRTTMMVQMIGMMVGLINQFGAEVLRDVNMF